MKKASNSPKKGLSIGHQFTKSQSDPYNHFNFTRRSSSICYPAGDVVFDMQEVEVPEACPQIATDILAQKYFRKTGVPQPDGSTGSETSARQVVHRLANNWLQWEEYWHPRTCSNGELFKENA